MFKDKLPVIVAIIAVGLIAVRNQDTNANASPSANSKPASVAKTWEHLAMNVPAGDTISTPEISRKIIKLGNDGWELVDVETMVKDGSTTELVYFFKRGE